MKPQLPVVLLIAVGLCFVGLMATGCASKQVKPVTPNRVLTLDGVEGYMEVSNAPTLNPTMAMTAEMWVKVDSVTGDSENIFLSKEAVYQCGIGHYAGYLPEQYFTYAISIGKVMETEESGRYDGKQRLALGRWYHIAITYDGEWTKAYVNGLLTASYSVEGLINQTKGVLRIGARSKRKPFFHGQIDELRIWNVSRTEEDIQATMKTTLAGDETGLIGYWNFDDGTANDLSKNGNDGMPNNGARITDAEIPNFER